MKLFKLLKTILHSLYITKYLAGEMVMATSGFFPFLNILMLPFVLTHYEGYTAAFFGLILSTLPFQIFIGKIEKLIEIRDIMAMSPGKRKRDARLSFLKENEEELLFRSKFVSLLMIAYLIIMGINWLTPVILIIMYIFSGYYLITMLYKYKNR